MQNGDTSARLLAAAKAAGIVVPKNEEAPVIAGANWLKGCVELLRKAGLGK
jgi:hypothetical protein